jgi:hypothetical protein
LSSPVPGRDGSVPAMMAAFRNLARLALLTAALPGALWTLPISTNGAPAVVTPTENVLVGGCSSITPDGLVAWRVVPIPQDAENCTTGVGDGQGNSYVMTVDSTDQSVIESVDHLGNIRWVTPTGGFVAWYVRPVIGANGDVYFSVWNGSTTKVIGLDEQTGAITFDRAFSDVTGTYTYADGLIVATIDNTVQYLGYDGNIQHTYTADTPLSAHEAYSNASGADGALFLTGYATHCGTGKLSVVKLTPAGIAWTWTDDTFHGCSQTFLTATPDGGVILARDEAVPSPSADFTSIDSAGTFRWDHHASGSTSAANYGGYWPPIADVNGIVALPSAFSYTCTQNVSELCEGAQVEFVSQQTDVPTLPPLQVTDPAGEKFSLYSLATDNERLYIEGRSPSVEPQSLSAFAVPGLAVDYRLALQETLLPGSTGSPGGSGGLTVQPPSPTPPLTVTVASGGGDGVAGGPDPSSLEHGLCDPGSDTSWLNIAGTTFTCILSGQVWNDPTLISARDRCVINLGIDFLPFIKALKLPKYVREAETVKLSLKTLAKRLASISYPGKLSKDAQAIDDIQTGLDLIKTPDQALLTAVSSRRVLDGLITKLGKGGSEARKLAQGVAIVKTAVVGLIEDVSGIQDLKDCVAAFNGP